MRGGARQAGSLPSPPTSLVGRRAEIRELRRLLAQSRLVTLTGTGGVGKSRLAVEAARMAAAGVEEGAWWIPLSELTDPALLGSSIVSALGKGERVGPETSEVSQFIGDREFLIILDNCEHLIDGVAGLVAQLLAQCSRVRLLATSREPLRVDGESLLRVSPLAVPGPEERLAPGAVKGFDAVALFLERAASLNPGFTLRAEDESTVAALCRTLDGLPLAIELGAAASRLLPLGTLAADANHYMRLTARGGRVAPARQQSLLATMDYSYDLCSEPARAMWARISVFRGGADLDAVVRVCGGEGFETEQVWRTLGELVDKSVVLFDGSRYRTLETVRAYGSERLRELGEERRLRVAHRDHFAALAADVESGWFGLDQPELLDRMMKDQANLRAALEFCAGDPEEVGVGLRMATHLYAFWLGSGLAGEGRYWLRDLLLAAGEGSEEERAPALWVAGFLAAIDGDVREGLAMLNDCRELALRLGDRASFAHATQKTGLAELLAGRTREAIAHLEQAVPLERELGGDNPFLADALVQLGYALWCGDHPDRAVEVLAEARTICDARGDQLLSSWSMALLALAAVIDKRPEPAVSLLKDALVRKRDIDDHLGLHWCVEMLGWVALEQGDVERGVRLMAASEALSEPLGQHLSSYRRILEWHDEYLSRARRALSEAGFNAALNFGRSLANDQIVAYALDEKAEPEPCGQELPELAGLPLTPREREISRLIAAGRTNKEIAAQLVIGRRTVDTHVQHILDKLGCSSRTQVAALFGSLHASS